MNDELTTAVREILVTYGLGTLVLVAVVAIFVQLALVYATDRIQSHVRAAVSRELDRHKIGLELAADSVRVDFQRRLADFGEYNSRRHRAYRSLFQKLLEAEGAFAATVGGFVQPDYSKKSLAELKEIIDRLRLGDEVRDELVPLWEGDRSLAVTKLERFLAQARKNLALVKHQEFKNTWLRQGLYVSPEVDGVLQLSNLAMAAASAELLSGHSDGLRLLAKKKELIELTERARAVMQADLSRGDYGTQVAASLPEHQSSK